MKNFCRKIVLFILGITLAGIFASCTQSTGGGQAQVSLLAPVFTPSSGEFREGYKEITIANKNNEGDIFFTTDGSTPTNESPRYTEAFKIYSSKTIKAICIYNNSSSPIATAKYELNAGKTQSQLGVISGKIGLSANLSESIKEELKDSYVYIFSDDLPGIVKSVKLGESYYFDGLDTSKTYDFYFTNVEPGVVQGTKTSRAATAKDENGHPIVANKNSIKPEKGAGIDVDVNLTATGFIKGVAKRFDVTGTEESDHGGIVVYIPGTSYSAYTDENGNFTMSGIPQGLHTIRAQYAGYSFVEKENVLLKTNNENAPETVIEDSFNLSFGKGIVNGSIVLSDAVETGDNVGILVSLSEPTNTYAYSATTNLNGNFSIVDVYPGTYTIEMSKEGYLDSIIAEVKVTGASITTIPVTTLQVIGGSLSGKVTVKDLADYSGITVLAENDKGKKYFGITNSTGDFSWDKVSPGTYKITANYAGYKSVSVSNVIVSLGAEVQDILLSILEKATYTITGKVLREGMDSGFEGTSVVADNAFDKTFSKTAMTGTDGTYILSELEPGDYMITISREGYITDNSNYISVGNTAIEVVPDVILKNSLGSVKGTVELESALEHEGIDILLKSEKTDKTYSTVTDTLGRFSISGVVPGTWRVQATKSGYNTVFSDSFSVNAGNTAELSSMELKISHRSIYGSVLLEGRTDATGVRITATNVNQTNEIYSALSNKDGVYALSGMTPGEYILSYSYEGYRSYTGSSVNLKNDSSLNLDAITLIKATGKISGIVNLEGCTDHSGIEVTIVGTDYAYTTESDGSYEFTVPSGNYPGGVRFKRDDFKLTAKADTIPVLTDSTYGVLTVELKCISVPVNGQINLLGTDDNSGIKVTVDGVEDIETVTDTEGKWKLEHIPLGYQTFRFTKTNVPEVTYQKLIEPCNSFDAGSMEMIPDSATLKGIVTLEGMTDNSNIVVTVTTTGKEDLIVRTNAAGTFEVTNVLASGSHEVIFSKEGWDSQSLTVSGLNPLETRTIAGSGDYILKDTTKPVLSKVVLNGGANFTNKPKLEVALTAEDKGSGLKKMAVQVSRVRDDGTTVIFPTEKSFEDYKVSFDYDLSSLPTGIWANNGEYTLNVTVKDASGNVSETKTDSITITNQASILKGVLTGDDLHLTKVKSPYRVESNILCQEGDTLVIDPGVEIRFAGDFYLKVDGCIKAIGTDEQRIIFTRTDDSPAKGSGNYIDCNKTSNYPDNHWHYYYDDEGNVVSSEWNCQERIYNTETGYWEYPKDSNGNDIYRHIPGHLDGVSYWSGIQISNASDPLVMQDTYTYVSGNTLQYCDIEYAEYPLNKETNSGSGFLNYLNIKQNCVNEVYLKCESYKNDLVILNSNLSSGLYHYQWFGDSIVRILNSNISNKFRIATGGSKYIEIVNNNISATCNFDIGYSMYDDILIKNNNFENSLLNLSGYKREPDRLFINGNNFNECNRVIVDCSSSQSSQNKKLDFTNNYWGSAQTEELNIIGNKANASFITDYYDEFEYTRVDYSDWAQEPFENCGYLGDKFIDFELTVNGSTNPEEPSDALISVGARELYSENSLVNAKFALSQDELANASWGALNQSLTLDRNKTKDGYATVYAQTKDSKGNLSPVKTLKVAYDIPSVCFADGPMLENKYPERIEISGTSKESKVIYVYGFDKGSVSYTELSINGNVVSSNDYSYGGYSFVPYIMPAGEYLLTAKVKDSVNNEATTTMTLVITRDVNKADFEDSAYNPTTGQFIKDEDTAYLWHFDGDGNDPDGNNSLSVNLISDKGINGAAKSVSSYDTLQFNTSVNAITVEYWTKGLTSYCEVGLESMFKVYNYHWSDLSFSRWCSGSYVNNSNQASTENSNSNSYIKGDETWHYYSYVITDSYLAVYIDGYLESYQLITGKTLNHENNGYKLQISMDQLNETGAFDELRISTCARTPDEIKAYYDVAAPLYNPGE